MFQVHCISLNAEIMFGDKVSHFYLSMSGKVVPSKSWEIVQIIVIFSNSAATNNP